METYNMSLSNPISIYAVLVFATSLIGFTWLVIASICDNQDWKKLSCNNRPQDEKNQE
jgi:hypothetical protein